MLQIYEPEFLNIPFITVQTRSNSKSTKQQDLLVHVFLWIANIYIWFSLLYWTQQCNCCCKFLWLKGSYVDTKNNIILCIWCNVTCLRGLRLKKNIIFHIPYIIADPLCTTFLKRVDFYKAHRSEKRGALWLASYPVRCDWPNTSSVWRKCYSPYHIWKHTASPRHGSGNNTIARIKVTPSFFA